MLIKVFGIWLMASNINYLDERVHLIYDDSCQLFMNGGIFSWHNFKRPCNEVAEEINKQIKGKNNDR